jgi:hypothetical protein
VKAGCILKPTPMPCLAVKLKRGSSYNPTVRVNGRGTTLLYGNEDKLIVHILQFKHHLISLKIIDIWKLGYELFGANYSQSRMAWKKPIVSV